MNYKLLHKKSFFLLVQGSFVSQIGSMMQTFALSLYVLNQYNSATLFASILIVSIFPRLIIGPFAGVLVDWFDRKKIIVRLDILSGIVVGLTAILYYQLGELPLWSIYTVTILLALIATLFHPAASTVIPTIIDKEDLVDANSIFGVTNTISNMMSPLLGGFLMSFSTIGIILIVNSVSFIVSGITEMFIEMPTKTKAKETINIKAFKNDFIEGIQFIKNTKFVLMIGFVACFLNLGISPVFSVAVPFILKKVMIVKDFEFGLLNGFVATASIVASLFAPRLVKKLSINKILFMDFVTQPIIVGFIIIITSEFLLNISGGYYLPLILLGLVQYVLVLAITMGNIVIGTTFQKQIPNELLGRVGTVIGTFAMAAIPLGQGIYGLLLEHFKPWVPMSGSVVLLLFVVYKAYPVLKNTDYSQDEHKSITAEESV